LFSTAERPDRSSDLPDNELVIRTDAGADLCRWDQNWKMHVPMLVHHGGAELYP
jgi:hypothetical protein